MSLLPVILRCALVQTENLLVNRAVSQQCKLSCGAVYSFTEQIQAGVSYSSDCY